LESEANVDASNQIRWREANRTTLRNSNQHESGAWSRGKTNFNDLFMVAPGQIHRNVKAPAHFDGGVCLTHHFAAIPGDGTRAYDAPA
jgi:hypothetical protein